MARLQQKLLALEEEFLLPDPSDVAARAAFLSQPETGIVRLLPREIYDKPGKMTMRGGGAYYSFTRRAHEYGSGSDLELQGGQFTSGFAGANFGLLARLGGVPIDDVTIDHPAVSAIADFTPPNRVEGARAIQERDYEGIDFGGTTYKSWSSVVVGETYVLRSVDYDTSDVLVAFQPIRRDADDSVVLLWKVLKRYPRPIFVRD